MGPIEVEKVTWTHRSVESQLTASRPEGSLKKSLPLKNRKMEKGEKKLLLHSFTDALLSSLLSSTAAAAHHRRVCVFGNIKSLLVTNKPLQCAPVHVQPPPPASHQEVVLHKSGSHISFLHNSCVAIKKRS